ncbi:MAG: geranylgeranyl diphosphate synthase type II [Phycisphaerales bacterium]|jgi:geranylgeranyl diphosphate synthase type II
METELSTAPTNPTSPQPPEPPTAGSEGLAIVAAVDSYLGRYLTGLSLAANLDEAIRYSLLGGGKRMRPTLAWLSALAVGGAGEASLPGGASVELVHAFSLVHDDLPAMDDDDLRRGRPTLHRHVGEGMAILAGDAMLALAFGVLGEIGEANLRGQLHSELVAGTVGMINGQVYDTMGCFECAGERTGGVGVGGASDEQKLRLIHENKTGALIRASCRMGAMLGLGPNSGEEALASITRFGEIVGLQFQVLDDLLDVTASVDEMGKQTGKDAQAGKLTYPGVFGADRTKQIAGELHARAVAALGPLGQAADGLRSIADYLAGRSA